MCLYTIGNIKVALASDSSFNTSLHMHTATKGKWMEYTVVLKILSTLKEIEMIEMKMMNGHDLDGRYDSFKDNIERADNGKAFMK